MYCRACESKINPFFSLGDIPLVNNLLTPEAVGSERGYDLTVAFCPSCNLVQLTKTVPPEELFEHYLYLSSVSATILAHNEQTARYLTERLKLGKESLVVEVGSNDGALLQYFKALGVGVLGIDPAQNVARMANEAGIPTVPEFFRMALAERLRDIGIRADLLYGANVLAHVPGIRDFVGGVHLMLKSQGTAVFEFPYLKGLMERKFDIIYHEHVFYYSLIALESLFARAGLEIYDVEMVPMQGGSLRIFAAHAGAFSVTERVHNLRARERAEGLDRFETYQHLEQRISQLKSDLASLLQRLKSEGKRVAAYSVPAKGVVLLNYFGIGKRELDFIVDKSAAKQGYYVPGVHMLIHGLNKIDSAKPDYLLVLCWNIADEVFAMEELKNFRARGGKFIVPVPEIRIVE